MRVPVSFVFLALVFGEIAGFVLVGKLIGLLPTLGLVLLGMVGGMLLLREQGIRTLLKAKAAADAGRTPGRPLAEGAVHAVAALLIIVPGFITDIAGLLLLVPPVRNALLRAIAGRVATGGRPGGSGDGARVIDLGEGDYSAQRRRESPWRLGRGPQA
jgi:UPF0716 protein FxsA